MAGISRSEDGRNENLATSGLIKEAMHLPNGANFYRCALQINPFDYLKRHNKQTIFEDEASYNEAIIATCKVLGINVIGVTDHYRVDGSAGLISAARAAGLFAFTGFEAVTKDGVHMLALFNPGRDASLERIIGDCGIIHNKDELSPIGTLDCLELLARAKTWEAVFIAAHVAADGGLLKKLSGQTRANAWRSPNLLACALAGPVSDAPQGLRLILENKDAEHRRERPVAVMAAQDVNAPDDLRKPGASCFIKMSEVSVEALRQAFLDPVSRVRLNSDPIAEPHTEFVAMAWEGGFLRNTAIHFNKNLNVLVGGRGTGKSTVIESLRYVLGLDPLGDDARKAHEGVTRHVLGSGTKISLLVRSHKPQPRSYTIERTIPNPPIVKDATGAVQSLTPADVIPGVEIFGQHEISELTKSPEKLTRLLERFMERDPSHADRKAKLHLALEQERSRIGDVNRNIKSIDDRLMVLPGLEERLRRFQEAGLEERLKEKSQLVREERILDSINERLAPLHALHRELSSSLPLDTALVAAKALEGLANADILGEADGSLQNLSERLQRIAGEIDGALQDTAASLAAMRGRWDERRQATEATYEKLLRDLQHSKIDGAEFIGLRQQYETLHPLRLQRETLTRDLATHETYRRQLLADWEDIRAAEYRRIEQAAKKISQKLKDRVRVEVIHDGNREPLEKLLTEEIGGNLKPTFAQLRERAEFSLPDFVAHCREGKDALTKHYKLTPGVADKIAQADPDLFMRLEQLELTATTKIALNTAQDGQAANWQPLKSLSTGQKATAVLLLLLLKSEAPLVVDQPEDDLDNRFITEDVVPIMREEKQRRQFVFSTHNANIPVLGDAELILGLGATGDGTDGQAQIKPETMGSIDSRPVRELVEEILEGGKTAFEMRRLKYGF